MSYWSRIVNVFRSDRVNREIEEELRAHMEEAIAEGRDPEEVRRSFGEPLHLREASRDARIANWLDSVRADVVFGWRQLRRNRVASAAAILSLALAIGACSSAFRLIDALLLRPMPVADPYRLYSLAYPTDEARADDSFADSFEYPLFRELTTAAGNQAELLAISYGVRIDITYGTDDDMEKAARQFVSGRMFGVFGLKPALGRLLGESDDREPGKHPYAVISYDYWERRFGKDPKVIGRKLRMGEWSYEIVGVLQPGFTGTETGTVTDIFAPTMMNAKAINNPNWGWFRTWVQLREGASPEALRQSLQARFQAYRREKTAGNSNTPKARVERYVNAPLQLRAASAGVSGAQRDYRRALWILGALVGLVLLIACVNVANLMTAQAAARAREMALRVSIGAGQLRLVQLVMVESTLIAALASVLGALFAWWAAPFVVNMIGSADEPVRLVLPADGRVFGFSFALCAGVALLFGMAPALRASKVRPAVALKGGEDPHGRRRLMHVLVAAQVAFCFLVHFVAGLFVASFDRLTHQPTGFRQERLLVLDTSSKTEVPIAHWEQMAGHLRSLPRVESVGLSSWALMSGNAWTSDVWVDGRAPSDTAPPYFLRVSEGWLDTMGIEKIGGRDFLPGEAAPEVAVVNEAFARYYFDGANPVGRDIEQRRRDVSHKIKVVGLVRDAKYRNMREPIRATVYLPFRERDEKGALKGQSWASFIVRTREANPLVLADHLRQEIRKTRGDFRVMNVALQSDLVRSHTIRERLLAMLSLFFAGVALLLAGVGLYGVLYYSVLQRQREISIRMALGARAGDLARRVTAEVFGMLLLGAAAGLAAGIGAEQWFSTVLYGVKATDLRMAALPALTIFGTALLAALPPVLRAVRVNPALALRAE